MDGAALKTTILQSLTQLHGEVGAAVLADVLAFDSTTARALIRTTAGWVPAGERRGRWHRRRILAQRRWHQVYRG